MNNEVQPNNTQTRITHRDNESQSLPGAGFSSSQDISAAEGVGQRSSLNVGHFGEFQLGQAIFGLLREWQLRKGFGASIRRKGAIGKPANGGLGRRRRKGERVRAGVGFYRVNPQFEELDFLDLGEAALELEVPGFRSFHCSGDQFGVRVLEEKGFMLYSTLRIPNRQD